MLSQSIYHEIQFLVHSFALGVVITFFYDNIRVIRRVLRHNIFFVSMEDFFFWIVVALSIFLLQHRENNGIFRWFSILGALFGMLFYRKLFSGLYIKYMTLLLKRILHMLYIFFSFLLTPVYLLEKRILELLHRVRQKSRHVMAMRKIRLTSYRKMIRMTLCKRKKKQPGKKRRKHEQKDSRS